LDQLGIKRRRDRASFPLTSGSLDFLPFPFALSSGISSSADELSFFYSSKIAAPFAAFSKVSSSSSFPRIFSFKE
jgi:hypothetical protein